LGDRPNPSLVCGGFSLRESMSRGQGVTFGWISIKETLLDVPPNHCFAPTP
jgi:hypothetical protein